MVTAWLNCDSPLGITRAAAAEGDEAACRLPAGERHGVNYPPYCAGWHIVPNTLEGGDRRTDVKRLYPDDTFYIHPDQGGRILDVTKPPFNAKGDGRTDDTAALIAAWDFVAAKLDQYGPNSPSAQYIIYLPAGTYLVSDTIVYTGDRYPLADWPGGYEAQFIRFVGEARKKTEIRLKDNALGFDDTESPKPVVQFGKAAFNNLETKNTFRGISINTGRGNPGAVGVEFNGANANELEDTTIYSLDGQGKIGLHIRIEPSQVYLHDMTIAGFDYGISINAYHATVAAIEYATLWGQQKAAIQVGHAGASIRKIVSVNRKPAVLVTGSGGQAVVVDSKLLGGDADRAAIQADAGIVFARSIESADYGRAIDSGGAPAVTGPGVDEFVSAPAATLFGSPPVHSLPLAVKELPAAKKDWPKPKDWASVDAFGAVGDGVTDDSPAIQAAMNTGLPVVYFAKKSYRMAQRVAVPATVKRINLLYSTIDGAIFDATFRLEEDSPTPLIVEDGYGVNNAAVVSAGPRSVILNHTGSIRYRNESNGTAPDLFINAGSALGLMLVNQQNAWFRMANTEPKTPGSGRTAAFTCDGGGHLWVLGFKTETTLSAFTAKNGCKLEILGGVANQTPFRTTPTSPYPALRVENAQASAILHTSGHQGLNRGYDNGVKTKIGTVERQIAYSAFPAREGAIPARPHNWFMPLYIDQP